MNLYSLRDIRQIYNGRTILQIDHLNIEAGYIHALLGPNGAGKTTLLEILAFLSRPAKGQLFFREQFVPFDTRHLPSLRRQVVLVDQHPIMFSTTVSRNIEYGLQLRKIDKKKRLLTVDRVLDIVGLSQYRTSAAHQLSGGETQRLALARALALEPQVLLCDEPTASVDSENQVVIERLLQHINEELLTTIIFTTHDRIQAAALAQKTMVLEKGRPVSATFENSFAATITPQDEHTLLCNLHDQVIFTLPRTPEWRVTEKFHAGRISLTPEKIMFRRPQLAEKRTRDELCGKVILLMVEGEKVRMVVDVGVRITVILDEKRYRKEMPAVGEFLLLRPAKDGCSFIPKQDD